MPETGGWGGSEQPVRMPIWLSCFQIDSVDRGFLRGLSNSQSYEESVFCVNNPRAEPRVLAVAKWRATRRVKISR